MVAFIVAIMGKDVENTRIYFILFFHQGINPAEGGDAGISSAINTFVKTDLGIPQESN
jgi:hypothetical protein